MPDKPARYNRLTAEQILKKLVTNFFWNDESNKLEWSYKEGTKIDDIDAELGKAVRLFRNKHEE